MELMIKILIQLICGFLALRRITRQQAARFHLHQVEIILMILMVIMVLRVMVILMVIGHIHCGSFLSSSALAWWVSTTLPSWRPTKTFL